MLGTRVIFSHSLLSALCLLIKINLITLRKECVQKPLVIALSRNCILFKHDRLNEALILRRPISSCVFYNLIY